MKKMFVAFGIAIAVFCGGAFVYTNSTTNAEAEEAKVVEVNLDDAIEAYVEDDNPGIDVVDVDIYDRTFKDNGQDWASYLVRDSNGNLGVGGINVEYVSNWYIRNA